MLRTPIFGPKSKQGVCLCEVQIDPLHHAIHWHTTTITIKIKMELYMIGLICGLALLTLGILMGICHAAQVITKPPNTKVYMDTSPLTSIIVLDTVAATVAGAEATLASAFTLESTTPSVEHDMV